MRVSEFKNHIHFNPETISHSRATLPLMILIVLTGFDFLTKDIAITFWKDTPGLTVIDNFLSFEYVENQEGAFQIGHDLPGEVKRPLFISIGIVALAAVSIAAYRIHLSNVGLYGMMFILAGAVGNIGDRMFRGFVVDFIHFYHNTFDWPIFNLADVYIDIGLALILTDSYMKWRYRKSEEK